MREVYRIYVEKRPENAVEALDTLNDLHTQLKFCVPTTTCGHGLGACSFALGVPGRGRV